MKQILIAAFALVLAACDAGDAVSARPDFRPALDAHLAAIQARDLEALKPTITSGEDLLLVSPGGEVIETTEGFVALHEEWFKDANWRWDGEVVKIMEGEDMAAAFVKYDYRDTPEGEPRSSWLLLLFQLEDGAWRLIHDQNTRITQTPEQTAEAQTTEESE